MADGTVSEPRPIADPETQALNLARELAARPFGDIIVLNACYRHLPTIEQDVVDIGDLEELLTESGAKVLDLNAALNRLSSFVGAGDWAIFLAGEEDIIKGSTIRAALALIID